MATNPGNTNTRNQAIVWGIVAVIVIAALAYVIVSYTPGSTSRGLNGPDYGNSGYTGSVTNTTGPGTSSAQPPSSGSPSPAAAPTAPPDEETPYDPVNPVNPAPEAAP